MVIIRLARSGAKKNPYYNITVADERKPRDGAFIERLGFFNPTAQGQEERLRINLEKVDQWITKGAQLSERVASLVKEAKLTPEELEAKLAAKKAKQDAKKEAIAKKLAEEAAAKALEEEATEDEEEATKPKSKKQPKLPTAYEVAVHELTHLPYQSWCSTCVRARGKHDQHRLQKTANSIPRILIDYAFLTTGGDDSTRHV